jgi:uncharacterized protein YjbJ (UPF0337 family)
MAINAQELQGQWNQVKGKVKEKWGQLTDDDVNIGSGNLDTIIGKIQSRTGEARDAIEKFFGSLTSGTASAVSGAAEKARDFAAGAGDRLKDSYGHVSEFAHERYEQAEDIVRHRPAQSIAAAFGLGLVVGLVVGIAVRSR